MRRDFEEFLADRSLLRGLSGDASYAPTKARNLRYILLTVFSLALTTPALNRPVLGGFFFAVAVLVDHVQTPEKFSARERYRHLSFDRIADLLFLGLIGYTLNVPIPLLLIALPIYFLQFYGKLAALLIWPRRNSEEGRSETAKLNSILLSNENFTPGGRELLFIPAMTPAINADPTTMFSLFIAGCLISILLASAEFLRISTHHE